MRCRLWTQSADVWPVMPRSPSAKDGGKDCVNDEACCDSMPIGSPVASLSSADLAHEAALLQITPTTVGVATRRPAAASRSGGECLAEVVRQAGMPQLRQGLG